MPPSRFVLASISLPSGGPIASGGHDGLCFSWRGSETSTQLLAFINAPISLSIVEGSGTADSVTPTGASGERDAHAQPQAGQQAPRLPRFPPWKKEGLPPSPASKNRHVVAEQGQADDVGSIAVETCGGRKRRVYIARGAAQPPSRRPGEATTAQWEGFDIVDERQTHEDHFRALIHSYLLPNGFPDSVAPQYAPYMAWRGVQYFFGGAMSVFTTQSLLGALGVAGRYSGEAAAAINWVIKDGAGRLGRLLFARWGRELDCELKQFRLAGDLLMEAGAALELATIYAPPAFLPLACTANLSKNLAAVAASSTRAPIYRTFALQNNLADITAKGESVANLADILGTVAGIALSRLRLPLVPTFCVLSAGYLLASRREVDSVELPYMNRARLAYATRRYLADGAVPGVAEANHNEPLLPWGRYNQGRLVLGASVEAACAGPSELGYAAGLFREGNYRYMVTYRPDTKKAYVLLREGATSLDCLQASFFGHVFLHLLDGGTLLAADLPLPPTYREAVHQHGEAPAGGPPAGRGCSGDASAAIAGCSGSSGAATSAAASGGGLCCGREISGRGACPAGAKGVQEARAVGGGVGTAGAGTAGAAGVREEAWRCAMVRAQGVVAALYPDFLAQADRNGWKLQQTMLNPKEYRVLQVTPLVAG